MCPGRSESQMPLDNQRLPLALTPVGAASETAPLQADPSGHLAPDLLCPLGIPPGLPGCLPRSGKRFYPFPEIKPPHFSLSDSELVSAPPCRHAALVYGAEINIRCL